MNDNDKGFSSADFMLWGILHNLNKEASEVGAHYVLMFRGSSLIEGFAVAHKTGATANILIDLDADGGRFAENVVAGIRSAIHRAKRMKKATQ
jgi:hypothetical protein